MAISRSNTMHQVSKPPRNRVASSLRDPRYKKRVVKSKKKYSRKSKNSKNLRTSG